MEELKEGWIWEAVFRLAMGAAPANALFLAGGTGAVPFVAVPVGGGGGCFNSGPGVDDGVDFRVDFTIGMPNDRRWTKQKTWPGTASSEQSGSGKEHCSERALLPVRVGANRAMADEFCSGGRPLAAPTPTPKPTDAGGIREDRLSWLRQR